ncbi:MAG: ribonuclease HIII [Planctomycetota bacterium]|jgi:ribonuclease HIII
MPVTKMSEGEIAELRQRLEREGFEFRSLDYAHFQARGPNVVVNAYRSGKVVFQGKGADAFLQSAGIDESAAPSRAQGFGLKVPTAGSDESGKGDYFGPLVVAAVVVAPDQVKSLETAGVRDCKKMADSTVLRAAKSIRDLCPHGVIRLDPSAYNAQHKEEGNVALFLSRMHAQAIKEAVSNAPTCEAVVIDQFTFASRLENALADEGLDLPVEIRTKAEDNPAVAAASVLARAEFLLALKELGHEWGVELKKGASAAVEAVAREIYRAGGRDALDKVAKTHFRTTQRVTQETF